MQVLRQRGYQRLYQCHHIVVVGIRLIGFQQRELRVVVLVNAFVAEHAANFVHLVQAADDEPFQVKFGGNPQIELLVQRVVVGYKGAGVGAGGDWHQDGRVHFHKAAPVKKTADAADDAAALHESVGHFRVGNQVQVALAIAGFHIAQAVPLFGQRAHPFGEDGQRLRLNGGLPGARPHHPTADAQKIAQVQVGQQCVVRAEHILPQHRLHDAGAIAQVQECRPPHHAH